MKPLSYLCLFFAALILYGCPKLPCEDEVASEYCLAIADDCVCLDFIEINGSHWERTTDGNAPFSFRTDAVNKNTITMRASNLPAGSTATFKLGIDLDGDGEFLGNEILFEAPADANGQATGSFLMSVRAAFPASLTGLLELENQDGGGIIKRPLCALAPNCYIQIGGGDSCRTTLKHLVSFPGQRECYYPVVDGILNFEFGIEIPGPTGFPATTVSLPVTAVSYLGTDGSLSIPLSPIEPSPEITVIINDDGTSDPSLWATLAVDEAGAEPGIFEICFDSTPLAELDFICQQKEICTQFTLENCSCE